jgi:hypothetical protein
VLKILRMPLYKANDSSFKIINTGHLDPFNKNKNMLKKTIILFSLCVNFAGAMEPVASTTAGNYYTPPPHVVRIFEMDPLERLSHISAMTEIQGLSQLSDDFKLYQQTALQMQSSLQEFENNLSRTKTSLLNHEDKSWEEPLRVMEKELEVLKSNFASTAQTIPTSFSISQQIETQCRVIQPDWTQQQLQDKMPPELCEIAAQIAELQKAINVLSSQGKLQGIGTSDQGNGKGNK